MTLAQQYADGDGDIACGNQIMNTHKFRLRTGLKKNLNIYKEILKIDWPENETFAISF